MKLAWCTPDIDQYDENELNELLKHLNVNGFAGIEPLYSEKPHFDPLKLKELLNSNDQKVIGLRTGGIAMKHKVSFSDPDSTIRGQAVEYFLDSISFASELNSPLLLVGLLQGRLSPTLPYADARKNIIECLTQCAAQAARSHITIGLEPVNRFLLGYHAKADEIIELIKEINLLNVRLLLDTYHMNMEESCMEETLISYAPWLVHVHLSDNNRRIPGRGSIDFARIIKVLKAINYQGYVSIEADDDDWFAAISASSRLLLPLFSSDKVNGK